MAANRTAAHFALPVGVTDHRGRLRTRANIFGQNEPALPGRNAQHAKEIAADPHGLRATQSASLPDIHAIRGPREHTGERLLTPLDLFPDRARQVRISALGNSDPAVASDDSH